MESKHHMLEGIARMQRGEWLTALSHFDRAVELRERLPWHNDVESAWVLAAAWINRSDVLRFIGKPEEGILSLDRAINAMSYVRLEMNPGYADRLILAWINRGTACGEAQRMDESLDGFSTAEKLMEFWGGPTSSERKLMASMLHANRARVMLDFGRAIAGWGDVQMAVALLDGLEPVTAVTEAAIKARGILCRTLAHLLDEPHGSEHLGDWIARATDSVEEALSLARSSGYPGVWVADLVRYGARIYRICQPHFLGEFLCEWMTGEGPLAGDVELKREMANELVQAQAELERRVRRHPHDTEFVERAIQTLLTLQRAENKLNDAQVVVYRKRSSVVGEKLPVTVVCDFF